MPSDGCRFFRSRHIFRVLGNCQRSNISPVLLQRHVERIGKFSICFKLYLTVTLPLKSSRLADSICSSRYYALDKEMQRNLLFIIMRSQKPKLIVAGGFFKLDIIFSTSVRELRSNHV